MLCLALMLVVSAVSAFNVELPSLAREASAVDTDLRWIVDAYRLSFAAVLAGVEPPGQALFGMDRLAIDSLRAAERADSLLLAVTGTLTDAHDHLARSPRRSPTPCPA